MQAALEYSLPPQSQGSKLTTSLLA
ncbi:hypothetical protein HaLaN_03318, partial [Haematococcus lacustris]